MADEELPLCGICGDQCTENAKPSPWTGALLCHDCASEDDPTIDRDDHDYPWRDVL